MSNFEHPGGFRSMNEYPDIAKYLNGTVPYTSVAQCNSLILIGIRSIGLTVNINNVEYHYKETRADIGLVVKTIASSDDIVEGSNNLFFSRPRVLATPLAGFSLLLATAATVADSIIIACGKFQKQINDIKTALGLKANTADLSQNLRYETTWGSGSQTFTLPSAYFAISGVFVQGIALKSTQYTLTSSTQVTIDQTLDAGDYIVILYGTNASSNSAPYYTQSQVDSIAATKANTLDLSQILRYETTWVSGSQTFILPNTYYNIQSVVVQGISLKSTQYTLTSNTEVTINNTLSSNDYIVIIYGTNASAYDAPYFTQAQVTEGFEPKFNLSGVGSRNVSVLPDGTLSTGAFAVNIIQTDNRSLSQSDSGIFYNISIGTSEGTFTLPLVFNIGESITFIRSRASVVYFAVESGATIISVNNSLTLAPKGLVKALRIDNTTWLLTGDLQ
jgi:hypothetical protein